MTLFVAKRMDIGYFKFWLNNRLGVNDLWELIHNGENITLWCIEQTRKRTQLDVSEAEDCRADKDTKKPDLNNTVVDGMLTVIRVSFRNLPEGEGQKKG